MTKNTTPYRIGVISDTHGFVPAAALTRLEGVNLIVHAGDIGQDHVLIELEAVAPVKAVSGNVDGPPLPGRRPLIQRLETPLGRIAVVHGHMREAPAGDRSALAAFFAEFKPDIIIFGHTHIPCLEIIDGVTLFNPGSAGRVRLGRAPSIGIISANPDGGSLVIEHISLE
jgi:putative phosphoesterase